MARTQYTRQRELVEGLMDLRARMLEQFEQNSTALRRLTGLALVQEARIRKDGNPERVARALNPEPVELTLD